MKVISRDTYAIPVYSFDNPEEWDDEPNRPTSDSDDRLNVVLRERQTGPPHISVTLKHGDERGGSYTFRVTDEELQRCAYTGDDPSEVPVAVLHAVHEFGYSVENVVTLGQWYTDRWECQLAFSELLHLTEDIADPVLEELTRSTTYLLDTLDTVLVVRYGTTDDDFGSIRDAYRDAHSDPSPTGLDLGPLKDHFWEAAHEYDCAHLLGDEEGGNRINVGVATLEFEASNGSHLALDIATAFGIERFLFHQQNDDTCVYVGGEQSSRPNPQAVLTVQDEGYEVLNARTVATAQSATDLAEHALLFVDDLQSRDAFCADDPATPVAKLIDATYDRLFSLFQAYAAREYDPEQYAQQAEQVRTHVGLSPKQVGTLSQSKLTDLIVATVELMDTGASERARTRIKESPAYTDDLAEQTGGLGER